MERTFYKTGTLLIYDYCFAPEIVCPVHVLGPKVQGLS